MSGKVAVDSCVGGTPPTQVERANPFVVVELVEHANQIVVVELVERANQIILACPVGTGHLLSSLCYAIW